MTPTEEVTTREWQGLLTHDAAAAARARILTELTPHTLTTEEQVLCRQAFNRALAMQLLAMRDAVHRLSHGAKADLLLSLEILSASVAAAIADEQRAVATAVLTPDAAVRRG